VKTALQTQEEFEQRVGEALFPPARRTVSKDQIHSYCRSLNQLDWFHFDDERSQAAGFGGIIAPGSLTFALIHSTFFECVELINLKALFIGSDRFRVRRPIVAGETICLEMSISSVKARSEGFRVHYDFRWLGTNQDDVVSEGIFLVRYWPVPDQTPSGP